MINYKLQHGLDDWKHWYEVPAIFLEGDQDATPLIENTIENAEKNEQIIQSWKKVVVLRATADKPTPFYLGFYSMPMNLFLKHEFTTDMTYAMRIGPDPLKLYVIPKDLETPIKLEVVKFTTEDDPKYKDTILI